MRKIDRERKGNLREGQDLVIAGYAGLEGSRRIAKERESELLTWFCPEYVERMKQGLSVAIEEDSIPWREYQASEWEPVGEGGIFTALWNLSGAYQKGFEVDLHRILVRQETIEVCERYGLNPYRLYSKNCMLVAAEHGFHLAERLSEAGIPAAVIGRVTPGIQREICYGEVRGFLERPREDEITKLAGAGKRGKKNDEREDFGDHGKKQQD